MAFVTPSGAGPVWRNWNSNFCIINIEQNTSKFYLLQQQGHNLIINIHLPKTVKWACPKVNLIMSIMHCLNKRISISKCKTSADINVSHTRFYNGDRGEYLLMPVWQTITPVHFDNTLKF